MAGVHVMRHEVKFEMVVVLHFYLLWNGVHWNSLSSYCNLFFLCSGDIPGASQAFNVAY
jgi:hypothetical protein